MRLGLICAVVAFAPVSAAVAETSAADSDCYGSSVLSPTPFMGNHGEVFKLADGSLWEVQYEYEYLYEYYPDVVICPSRGKLLIQGKALNVRTLSAGGRPGGPAGDVIESQIDGDFEGWDGDTIFKLTNGQIWQQASYAYHYSYQFMPNVIIFKVGGHYEMRVEDVDERIAVRRLR